MKKVASLIGFGSLAAVAVAFVFSVITHLTVIGTPFDAMKNNVGAGIVSLISWIAGFAVAVILIIFCAFEIFKLIPVFSGKEVEDKSLVHANTVAIFAHGLYIVNFLLTLLMFAILKVNANIGAQGVFCLIFSIVGLLAGLASAFMKDKLGTLIVLVCSLVAVFFELVLTFMGMGGGLVLVANIFLVIGLFGLVAYIVVANLDGFKK